MMSLEEEVTAQQQLDFAWERTFSIIPRRCELSGDKIPMFSYAYKGVRETRVPHVNWRFTAWAKVGHYVVEKIKDNVN